jgi:hypothetical protein
MIHSLARCLCMLTVLPALAGAQQRLSIGPRLGYHEIVEAISVGAEVKFALTRALAFRPSVDLMAVEYGSYRAYNIDLQYAVTRVLYVGGGAARRRFAAGDAVGDVLGGNLFAGVELAHDAFEAFAEWRAFVKAGTHGSVILGFRAGL